MQLALLIGANPQRFDRGPTVRLPAGSWRVLCHGMNSSVLALVVLGNAHTLSRITTFELDQAQDVFVKMEMRGVEDYISVVAEK